MYLLALLIMSLQYPRNITPRIEGEPTEFCGGKLGEFIFEISTILGGLLSLWACRHCRQSSCRLGGQSSQVF